MGLMRLALLALPILGLTACTEAPQWTLFYYPDVPTLPEPADRAHHIAGYYDNVEQCKAKGNGMLRLSDSGIGYFQCGKLCSASEDDDVKCDNLVEK